NIPASADEVKGKNDCAALLWQIDERNCATGHLRQRSVPFFESAKLENLRIRPKRVGLDSDRFGFSLRFRDFLLGFEFNLLELVLSGKRLLFGSDLRFNRFVEDFGELEIDDVEFVYQNISFLQLEFQLILDVFTHQLSFCD